VTAIHTGFAVASDGYFTIEIAPIVDEVPAGFRASEPLTAGACIKVHRGAPLPEGADAVVEMSRARVVDGGVILEEVGDAHGVSRAGDLISAGATLAEPGQILDADLIGTLARAAIRSVEVHPRPRVLVLTVGTEYVEPGVPTPTGLVADHLSYLAAAIVTECGGMAFRLPPVLDELGDVEQVVDDNAHRSDLIVLCGIDADSAPVLTDGLELVPVAADTGEIVLLGLREGAIILGLPDDPGSLRSTAGALLSAIIGRLMGRQ
jgi:molybdopterin molybdotransferase